MAETNGSSNDINLIDSNNNGLNLANKYAKPRPKGVDRFFLVVTGTSMPSNATHTKCNVQLQTNQHGYKPVSPLGPAGAYTSKTTATNTDRCLAISHTKADV